MKTFEMSKVFKKFLGGGVSVMLAAGAVNLAESKAGIKFEPQVQTMIVIPLVAAAIKAGNNLLKHKIGFDLLGTIGSIIKAK